MRTLLRLTDVTVSPSERLCVPLTGLRLDIASLCLTEFGVRTAFLVVSSVLNSAAPL